MTEEDLHRLYCLSHNLRIIPYFLIPKSRILISLKLIFD